MKGTEELKARANNAFQSGKYALADGLYSEALTTLGSEGGDEATAAVLLGNRAMTRLKLEMYAAAIDDATLALKRNSGYMKGYYRRGCALFALGKYKQAKRDFVVLAQRKPNDVHTRRYLRECEKRLREIAFARAIESGEKRVWVADTMDVDAFSVPDSYVGPRLGEDGVVSEAFVEEMIEHFRGEKKLHIKYAAMIILAAKRIMDALPNIVDVPLRKGQRITVCGDVHGQYYDLANAIFAVNGLPSAENPYVFNGAFCTGGCA